jgi:hypothetical protein
MEVADNLPGPRQYWLRACCSLWQWNSHFPPFALGIDDDKHDGIRGTALGRHLCRHILRSTNLLSTGLDDYFSDRNSLFLGSAARSHSCYQHAFDVFAELVLFAQFRRQ